jgi:hypothetical protein
MTIQKLPLIPHQHTMPLLSDLQLQSPISSLAHSDLHKCCDLAHAATALYPLAAHIEHAVLHSASAHHVHPAAQILLVAATAAAAAAAAAALHSASLAPYVLAVVLSLVAGIAAAAFALALIALSNAVLLPRVLQLPTLYHYLAW